MLLSTFLLPVMLVSAVSAVSITNYVNRGCSGSSRMCTNIAAHRCCSSRTRVFSSSRFVGTVDSELGSVCTKQGNNYCGKIKATKNGRNICVDRPVDQMLGLRGSYWFSCLTCTKKRFRRDIGAEFIGQNSTVVESVLEDKLTIDGHMFEINYDVPANITGHLEVLFDKDASYEDVPTELLEWEVSNPEQYL